MYMYVCGFLLFFGDKTRGGGHSFIFAADLYPSVLFTCTCVTKIINKILILIHPSSPSLPLFSLSLGSAAARRPCMPHGSGLLAPGAPPLHSRGAALAARAQKEAEARAPASASAGESSVRSTAGRWQTRAGYSCRPAYISRARPSRRRRPACVRAARSGWAHRPRRAAAAWSPWPSDHRAFAWRDARWPRPAPARYHGWGRGHLPRPLVGEVLLVAALEARSTNTAP